MKTKPFRSSSNRESRHGTVLPLVAFMLIAIFGVVAFVADTGRIVVVKSTLGAAADAAALAGAGAMAQSYNLDVVENTAVEYGQLNVPENYGQIMDETDVILGEWDPVARTFTPTNLEPNAVKVVAKRTSSRGNQVPYSFARIFGLENTEVSAEAIAVGANNTSDLLPSSEYTVYVTSTKDLSNVVLQFADGSPDQKFEPLSGYSRTFTSDKPISGVWIKSGCNMSGDGPGYGEFIARPDPDNGTTVNGKNKHKGCTPHVTATFQATGVTFTSSGAATPVRLVQ